MEEKDNEKNIYKPLFWFFGIVFILWILAWVLTQNLLPDNEQRSSFGDMFGSVNALFSGLALAGIIFTILLQKEELGLQRKELKDTRHEFEIQNETLKKQRFENTFFQMLNLQNDIASRYYSNKTNEDRFALAYDKFCMIRDQETLDNRRQIHGKSFEEISDIDIAEKILIKSSKKIFDDLNHHLSNYSQNLIHCFKLIYDTDLINSDEKTFYASIIKAQLSDRQLKMIFLYSIIPNNSKTGLLMYIKKYNVFENLDFKTIHPLGKDIFHRISTREQ